MYTQYIDWIISFLAITISYEIPLLIAQDIRMSVLTIWSYIILYSNSSYFIINRYHYQYNGTQCMTGTPGCFGVENNIFDCSGSVSSTECGFHDDIILLCNSEFGSN